MGNVSQDELLLLLPDTIIGVIYNFLSFDDCLKLCSTCHTLRSIQPVLEQQTDSFQVCTVIHHQHLTERYASWANLIDLDLSSFATNDSLMVLQAPLRRLKMVDSTCITDNGISKFCTRSRASRLNETLEYIDLTFCSRVTYLGTFPLRDTFPSLVIRRQPEWMDGHFVTPFDRDGLHSYWCDGSFQFEREQQSSGHIVQLFRHKLNCSKHLGDKLQYTNFVPPPGWPDWSRYCYRPGVSLYYLDVRPGEERSVLVGQCLRGIRPPHDYPKAEHVDILPLHASRYFNRAGNLLEEGHATDQRYMMVSRMKVLPLETLMPPQDMVERNRSFLMGIPEDLHLDRGEAFLHLVLDRA